MLGGESAGLPGKPAKIVGQGIFISAVRALRKLSMANFATKLARLDAIMERVHGNTHVATLQRWRAEGREAEFIHELTRGSGERKAKTAKDLVLYLCQGSPVARLVFQRIL